MTILLLVWEFFKTGLFAVGGGLATIPFLIRMSEQHPDWFSLEQLTNMVAISESTPGPIGINMATYTGYHVAGIPGGILASIAIVLPSFIIILLVSRAYRKYQQNQLVKNTFVVLRALVSGLVAAAAYVMIYAVLVDTTAAQPILNIPGLVIFACFVVVMLIPRLKKAHPLWFILAGAVVGIVFQLG